MNRAERRQLERGLVQRPAGILGTPGPGMIAVPAVEWTWSRAAYSLWPVLLRAPRGSVFLPDLRTSDIAGKRNALAAEFLRRPQLHWLLFIDADMEVPADTLTRLLAVPGDVVGGLYAGRLPPHHLEAGRVIEQAATPDPLRPTDNPECICEMIDWDEVGQVVEVDILGAGVMLIYRRVLEKLEAPWFVPNRGTGRLPEPGQAGHGMNEDLNFTVRAKAEGFRVICDTRVQAVHLGANGVTVDFARMHQYQLGHAASAHEAAR